MGSNKLPNNKDFFCKTCKKEVFQWIVLQLLQPPPPRKIVTPDGKPPGLGVALVQVCPRCGAIKLDGKVRERMVRELIVAESKGKTQEGEVN